MDIAAKKRRKVEQSPSSARSSPMVHGTSAVSKHPSSVVRPTFSVFGLPLVFGIGDTGQLGLGPNNSERSRPARFGQTSVDHLGFTVATLETGFIQVCAGGMHTVCLTSNGRVVTCGCNDEGALGRPVSVPAEPVATDTVTDQTAATSNGCTSNDASQLDMLQYTKTIVDETYPFYVPLPMRVRITMVSAGDSHTAALDSDGQVWIWGTFRGPSGPIGLTKAGEIAFTPKRLLNGSTWSCAAADTSNSTAGHSAQSTTNTALLHSTACVVKIASGQDHLVCLTEEGRLYTMGCGEQGQLGRIAERFARTGGRSGINSLLQPTECRVRGAVRFSDVWAGGFATIAVSQTTGDIFACGLNNYGQLALLHPARASSAARRQTTGSTAASDTEDTAHTNNNNTAISEDDVEMPEAAHSVDAALLITDRREADKSEAAMIARQGPLIQFMLVRACGFSPDRGWRQFAISMHHTLALDKDGHVYAVGRSDYGRLGLGSAASLSSDVTVTTVSRVKGALTDRVCTWIACGESCSFAVDTEGSAYSWGMGSNRQLGHGDADDDCHEPEVLQGKQLEERRVVMIDAGGQHTVLLAYKHSLVNSMVVEDKTNTGIQSEVNPESTAFDICIAQSAKLTPSIADHLAANTGIGTTDKFSKLADRDAYMVPGLCGGEALLVPPIGGAAPQARRPISGRRHSPCGSVSGAGLLLSTVGLGADSTTGSTACATINSSSVVSDTSSVSSCSSGHSGGGGHTAVGLLSTSSSMGSSSSQWNSARSTDGGGSSRCSSAFDLSSVQSSGAALSVPLQQQQAAAVLSPLSAGGLCDEVAAPAAVVLPDASDSVTGNPGDSRQLLAPDGDGDTTTATPTSVISGTSASESAGTHLVNT